MRESPYPCFRFKFPPEGPMANPCLSTFILQANRALPENIFDNTPEPCSAFPSRSVMQAEVAYGQAGVSASILGTAV